MDFRFSILDFRFQSSFRPKQKSQIKNQKSKIHGLTLVELLIVMSVIAVLMIATVPHIRGSRQVWEVVGDRHAEVLQNARIGMDKMTREIRQARSISSVSGSYIEFADRDENDRKFQYNAGYLEYGPPGDLSMLAGPVDSLSFTYYQEDGVTETTTPDDARSVLIQLTTSDSEGKVEPITLSSRVFIRKDIATDGAYSITDFVMFGGTSVFVDRDSTVTGNIGSNGTVSLGSGTTVDGDIIEDASVDVPDASSFSAGGANIIRGNYSDVDLAPGSYGHLLLGRYNTLNLQAGDYYFNSITTGSNLTLNVPSDGDIRIFVVGNALFGRDLETAIDGNVIDVSSESDRAEAREKAERIYVETLGTWIMGRDSVWAGTIFAPNNSMFFGRGEYIFGALYSGSSITVGRNSTVEFVAAEVLPPQFPQ
jgi:prepilin-type N-terminal cleavage/methylation domain-containing protein